MTKNKKDEKRVYDQILAEGEFLRLSSLLRGFAIKKASELGLLKKEV
ncbi:hypothetical protein ACFL22_00870 [Patescibacteria group bacterium]